MTNHEQMQSDLDAANAFIERLCSGLQERVTDAPPVTRENALEVVAAVISRASQLTAELERQKQIAHHLSEILRIRGAL